MTLTATLTPANVMAICHRIEDKLKQEGETEFTAFLMGQLEQLKDLAMAQDDCEYANHPFTTDDVMELIPGISDEEAEWVLEKADTEFDQTIGVNQSVLWSHAESLGLTPAQQELE